MYIALSVDGRTAYVPGKMNCRPIPLYPLAPTETGGNRSAVHSGLFATMPWATSSVRRSLRMPSVNAGR